METYDEQYQHYLEVTGTALQSLADEFLPEESTVGQAARYSLLGGGKRVRAILVLSVCALLGGQEDDAAPLAVAVEMLHAYSLIHDDLPCMDNDDFRRGRPSCHKAYGEATALLAGDALLTTAFEVIGAAPLPSAARARACLALAQGAGSRGMVYGQELDLRFEAVAATQEQLEQVHHYKTGCLINAAVQLGVAAANGSETDAIALQQYAFDLGLVFQIVDDVLDVTASEQELGKPVGSDAENGKTTFVTLYGAERAMKLAQEKTEAACARLQSRFGEKADFLVQLARSLAQRTH